MKNDLEEFLSAFDDMMPIAWVIFSAMMIAGCVWFELAMRAL